MKHLLKQAAVLMATISGSLLLTACGATVESIAEEISEEISKSKSFNITYDSDLIGAVDSKNVEIDGSFTRQQSETSGNIYEYVSNSATIGEARGNEYLTLFKTDGGFYCEDQDQLYVFDQPVLDLQDVPGKNFWPAFCKAEKLNLDEENLSCTVVLSGDELKESFKEFCYNVYTHVAPFADWNQMNAEFDVDLNEAGYIDSMSISSPDIGEIIVGLIDGGTDIVCSDFDVNVYLTYVDQDVLTPDSISSAVESDPIETYGVGVLIDFLNSQSKEMDEIKKEQEEAENFEPVELEGEGSITLSVAGKNVTFSLPVETGFYNRISQQDPTLAILTHDLFSDVTGRTIVQFIRGTAEGIFNSLGKDVANAKDVEVNGIKGKLIAETYKEKNSFGSEIVGKDFFFVAEMDETALVFRVEAVCKAENEDSIDETIIDTLLSHCTIE